MDIILCVEGWLLFTELGKIVFGTVLERKIRSFILAMLNLRSYLDV